MDPSTLIQAGVAIAGRLIDKEKPMGKTNLATAASVATGGAAYMFLLQSPEPIDKALGAVLTLATIGLAFYKESHKCDHNQLK